MKQHVNEKTTEKERVYWSLHLGKGTYQILKIRVRVMDIIGHSRNLQLTMK